MVVPPKSSVSIARRCSMSWPSARFSAFSSPSFCSLTGSSTTYRHTSAPTPMGGRIWGTAAPIKLVRLNGRFLAIEDMRLGRSFKRHGRVELAQGLNVFVGDAQHVARETDPG